MRNYTSQEREFLRSSARSAYGNKKRRKAKTRSSETWFSCGCCRLDDNRRKILDSIQFAEMSEYEGRGTAGD